MHLILLSGGSGRRLWPLSNDIRSKQFLQVLKAPNGDLESMVQRVYRQLQEVGGWSSITVAASSTQRDQLESQLGDNINIVIEPERRDTFPAIALACSYLYSECNIQFDENIAISPVDPYVDIDYFKSIAKFSEILDKEPNVLALLGATPNQPTDKYGYAVPENGNELVSVVKYFKEKPDRCTAGKLIAEGALWNCGVFGFKLGYIIDILKDNYQLTDFSFSQMKNQFLTLKKTSFDYAVVECAKNIKIVRYNGSWTDLGSWLTLSQEMAFKTFGNIKTDETCVDTYVINELDIPMIAIGIKNAVLVASRDGILVADKHETHRIKDFANDFCIRPMYEDKMWGSYQVLNHSLHENGTESLTKKLFIFQNRQVGYQKHICWKEVWTITSGRGWLCVDDKYSPISAGDTVLVGEGQCHALYTYTDLELIQVQMGELLIEDDIVSVDMKLNWPEEFLNKI